MGTLLKVWVVRHVGRGGCRVSKGDPGARAVREKSSKWYGQFKDADGRRRRVPLCKDKAAALQMLAELERGAARGRVGLTDPFAKHREAPLDDHVTAYEAHLRDNEDVSDKHLGETIRRLRAILTGSGASSIKDVRPDAVERVLRALAGRGAGARTRNTYLSSTRAFTRWCRESGRVEEDAMVAPPGGKPRKGRAHHLSASGEVRRKRRALTEDELIRLFKAARERPLREAMTIRTGARRGDVAGRVRPEVRERLERLGHERALLYKMMVLTGLRRGEMASLRAFHLRLEGEQPRVVLPGEATKNGEEARILLKAELAADLRVWLAETGRRGSDLVFNVPTELVKILRRDLAMAGIPYRDERGRTLDVHALRHTTATLLSRANVPPSVAQRIMRHSDIKLTMQVYTDVRQLDEAEAMASLPPFQSSGVVVPILEQE